MTRTSARYLAEIRGLESRIRLLELRRMSEGTLQAQLAALRKFQTVMRGP